VTKTFREQFFSCGYRRPLLTVNFLFCGCLVFVLCDDEEGFELCLPAMIDRLVVVEFFLMVIMCVCVCVCVCVCARANSSAVALLIHGVQ